ncbi:hypothetical protein JKF63_07261 [Porcisia hertigi]|uniref:Uncharacterized protein n=1 Tax=Porcisia hertigi TaxID=2761500 RepID=A0A836YGP0_9TRYP|nr:hypothetical protein JKF63_07261 [Porcisia hertigi]
MRHEDKPQSGGDVDVTGVVDAAVHGTRTVAAAAAAPATLTMTAAHRGTVAGKRNGKRTMGRATPKAGSATIEVKDDDSPEDPLAVALAQDAPLTFTACEDAKVIARLPLRFKDMLPTICHQLEFRQRQATHQTSVDAERFRSKENPLTSPASLTAEATHYPAPPYQHAHMSDMVMRLLPIAVGYTRRCKTSFMHATENEEDSTAGDTTTQMSMSVEEHRQQQSADQAEEDAVGIAPALTQKTEHQIFRTQTTEKLLDYLFSSAPSTEGAGNVDHDEARRGFTVAACLSGLREVSSNTVEYTDLLRQMVALADARRGAEPKSAVGEAEVKLPAYVHDLLVGVEPSENVPAAATTIPLSESIAAASSAQHPTTTSGNTSHSTADEASRAPYTKALAAAAVQRMPVVSQTLRSTLDAVLPPRLFIYYSIHQEKAMAVQEQRQAAKLRLESLRRHMEVHRNDTNARAEIEALSSALAVEYEETLVGAIVVILQRTSDVQSPRNYLAHLERTLDDVLREVKARCCGRPLKLTSTSSMKQRPQHHTASPPTLSSGSKTLLAPPGKTREVKENVHILSLPNNPVCTRTLKPLPAQPTPTSVSGGGSATVASTLNVLEANKERTLVQLNLLGEELLRQVTVDLPERGILFRRILDEAQLSIDARAILARERFKATQEHLLDGQDVREATEARRGTLEGEVAELRSQLAYVTARRVALKAWVEEKKAAEVQANRERVHFETSLRERLKAHTEKVKIAQDAARRGSLTG